jgi:hypothetical protein
MWHLILGSNKRLRRDEMKFKDIIYKKITLAFLFCFMLFLPSLANAEENTGPVNIEELSVGAGLIIPDYSGYQGRIGEYKIFKGVRPTLEFKGFGIIDGSTYFRVEGFYEDEKDQTYAADIDFKRILKGEFDYSRFRHWTDHDPLNIPWTSEDRDPGTDYRLTRSLTKAKIVYSPAGLPNISFNLNYREEGRSGVRQVLSIQDLFGKILSDGKPTDEVTRDYEAGVTFRHRLLTLDNTFWYRKFEDEASKNVFTDRGQPFTLVPEFDRYQNTLSARVNDLPFNTGFYTNYTYYKVDSTESKSEFRREGEIDYNSFLARLTSIPVTNLTLGLAYRYQKVENDLRKWYDASLPSALDRDVNTFTFDSALRIIRSTTLRYEFEWEGISRKDSGLEQIHPVETERISHRIAVQSRLPVAGKKVRIKAEYKRDDIDDPFSNLRFWHDAREAGEYYPQLSQNPKESDRVRVRLAIPLATGFDLSLDGEWGEKEFESENANSTQWKEDYWQPSITLSYTPLSNLTSYFSYAYSRKRTDNQFATDPRFAFAPELPSAFSSKYKEDVNIWIAGLCYQPVTDLNLSGFVTYATHKAKFDSSDLNGADLSLLSNLGQESEHDIKTSELSLAGDYRISKKLFLTAKFIYEYFDNDAIYLYDVSGKGYMGFVGLTWKFISL